jgi:hypothetical protein
MEMQVKEALFDYTGLWDVDVSKVPPAVAHGVISREEFILVKLEESSRVRNCTRLGFDVAGTQNLGQHVKDAFVAAVAN